MHSYKVLSLFAVLAATSPVVTRDKNGGTTIVSRGRDTDELSLDRCKNAENCEIVDDPFWGKSIRFKNGQEPGTEAYKKMRKRNEEVIMKRREAGNTISQRDDSGGNTIVTTSDQSINFGSVRASGEGGVYHHLYDLCHEGGCETNPYTVSSTYASDTESYQQDIALSARGQYNGWDERTVFIESVVAVAGTNEDCQDKDWAHVNGGGCIGCAVETGTVNMCRQTYFIQINHWGPDGSLHGNIEATTQEIENQNGWCQFLNMVESAAGILGSVPGAGAIGSAADFFGLITGSGC